VSIDYGDDKLTVTESSYNSGQMNRASENTEIAADQTTLTLLISRISQNKTPS